MNRHQLLFRFILFLLIIQSGSIPAQSILPMPDHIVVLILENHNFNQIIGSSAAPYINSLTNDIATALFTGSYGITHPSQPNYLALYSGSTQGITGDAIPASNPFTTVNLGSQLINSGKTFVTYSEDLPVAGFNGEISGYYARKHNPVTNWVGNGINQVSQGTNQPFTAFPADFNLLPTVSFVVPNLQNDMHNGIDPSRITTGDAWISNHLNNYIQWAKSHNSLFILTFDEDNNTASNQISTILTGQMIIPGTYSIKINHYSILHTIEKMYGLPNIGDSITYPPIDLNWKTSIPTYNLSEEIMYPIPAKDFFYIIQSDVKDAVAEIRTLKGELIQEQPLVSIKTYVNIQNLKSGIYLVKISNKGGMIVRKLIKS